MGFIFRAYFAPMARLNSPQGIPTKVPYLFSNMLRKLQKEHAPDYLAVVFDTREPTFRDKLFDKYKAQRPPMPDDLAVQLPYVRRMCEAMRLPILEFRGFEADDVIGALAKQAAKKGARSFHRDQRQGHDAAGRRKRARAASRRGAPDKTDLVVDAAKVEEIMGVPPEKVADVMALMGDSIDNIPGAKGIGEKGAKELIRRFGSAEAALDRAKEVEGKRYREALENSRDAVMMSKQLAVIDTAAPVKLVLDDLRARDPDVEALRALYAELGFTSLLRDLPAAPAASAARAAAIDSAALESPAALKKYLSAIPRDAETAVWLTLAEGENAKKKASARKSRRLKFRRSPAFRGRQRSTPRERCGPCSREFLRDPRAPKIVHDPKALRAAGRPRRRNPPRDDAVFLSAAPHHVETQPGRRGVAAGKRHALRRARRTRGTFAAPRAASCGRKWKPKASRNFTRRSTCRSRRCWPRWSATACASTAKRWTPCPRSMELEIRSLEKTDLGYSPDWNSTSVRRMQLAEVLFDKMGLTLGGRRRGKPRSTAADVLEELALLHELPRKVIEYRELTKLKSTYVDALPKLIHAGDRPPAHQLQPDRTRRRAASVPRTRTCKIFPCARSWAARFAPRSSPARATRCFPPIIRRSSCASWRISQKILCWSKRSAPGRTSTRAPREEVFGVGPDGAKCRAPPRGQGHQFRHHLRTNAVRPRGAARASTKKKPRNSSPLISRAIAA